MVVFDFFENYAHYVFNRLWYMYILVVNLYKAVYTFRDSLNTRRYWTTLLQPLTPSWILLHPTSPVWPVQTSGRNWKLYPPSKPCWNLVRICLIYKFHIQITKPLIIFQICIWFFCCFPHIQIKKKKHIQRWNWFNRLKSLMSLKRKNCLRIWRSKDAY